MENSSAGEFDMADDVKLMLPALDMVNDDDKDREKIVNNEKPICKAEAVEGVKLKSEACNLIEKSQDEFEATNEDIDDAVIIKVDQPSTSAAAKAEGEEKEDDDADDENADIRHKDENDDDNDGDDDFFVRRVPQPINKEVTIREPSSQPQQERSS
ncbi:protein MAK16 homolog [Cynara cardunculus var. scolymus]|uniref:protein MAK16 homolog n=1 Tax=Cynara cardunculus var. scolymus TaxID=59895 RepID=UPI000D62BC20|nr:protein MAK16 homolog [Cynara cardunculus var. scolymus]